MRICNKCKGIYPHYEMSYTGSGGTHYGRYASCKECLRKYRKEYRLTIGGQRLEACNRWRREGLVDIDRAWELKTTVKECAICGTEDTLVVDHNHKTGMTRNVLCDNCNRGIGCLRDDVKIMERAIDYIKNDGHL